MRRQKKITDVVERRNYSDDRTKIIKLVIVFIVIGFLINTFNKVDPDFSIDIETFIQEPDRSILESKPKPKAVQKETRPVERPARQAVRQPSKQPEPINADHVVTIQLGESTFEPVLFKAGSRHKPLQTSVSPEPFSPLVNEPEYTGRKQWYGLLELGNQPDNTFDFVLDQQSSARLLMYFDRNNNNDLSDDGEPLVNMGSGNGTPGKFSTRLSVPWSLLFKRAPFEGEFEIWFFSNEYGWKNGKRVSHYSRTQLRGEVEVAGKSYLAMLIDDGYNDANLFNDGVALDVNGNGKIDSDEPRSNVHTIDGESYQFIFLW